MSVLKPPGGAAGLWAYSSPGGAAGLTICKIIVIPNCEFFMRNNPRQVNYDKRNYFQPQIFNRAHTQQPNSRKVTKIHFLTFEGLNENICLWLVYEPSFSWSHWIRQNKSKFMSIWVDLLTGRVFRPGIYRCGELGRSRTNEVSRRGLPGTRSMVFSNINDVKSHLFHGISWCLCKYKVEVMRHFRRFVWGWRFRGLWPYL